ncbi:hypothetical protein [Sporosarcina beigongshangi]|uniref:hypothetical protein n=1 Tax=Sporosarcina beigongshangi TaxID=2782538 RepID=UPI00193A0635|nr:hypothetical protein [Sporosarcina beigongshangi]
MWKKLMLFMLLLMATFFFIPTATALAAPELKVSVAFGLDGKAKYGKGAPVTVTIENTGTAFSGDMVIDMEYTYSMGAGEAFPLEIGAGETKTVSFVNGKMNDNGNPFNSQSSKTIFFYEGGWQKGKEIKHKGSQHIPAILQNADNTFAVLFTDNVDRLTALKKVRHGASTTLVSVDAAKISEKTKFPEEAVGWEAANYIIIDEYPLADLSSKQQQALLGWVRTGGILIMGGSDNSRAEAGLFAEYLPLKFNGQKEMNAAVLNNWAATEGIEGIVASYETELTEHANSLLEDEGNVLIAYKRLGDGVIIQTPFSVGDSPLAEMEGMTAFWNTLFVAGERVAPKSTSSTNYYSDEPMEAIVYSVGDVNELFPSFRVSAPVILGIIILYMVLIIPVLYFILRRKDKREYTWWIIPAIAVLTSIAIFAYGAKDRIARAQIQHTAMLNVALDGSMTGYYAESLLTNRSGNFTFTTAAETTLFASNRGDDLFGSSTSIPVHKRTMLEKDTEGSRVHLRNAGYWDVATIYGQTTVENVGTFGNQLKVVDKQLTGTVTNDFPFALTDVVIWSGVQQIALGDLGPGETVQVNETLKTSTLLPRRSIFNSYSTPYMNPQQGQTNNLTKMRRDSMLAFSGEHMNKVGKPAIIGYTDTQIVPIELVNGKPTVSSMTMVAQPIEVDVLFSSAVTVEPEMMEMSVVSETTLHRAEQAGYATPDYYFNEPAYLQTWKIPEKLLAMKLKWTSLEVWKVQQQLYEVSILNSKTGEFEPQDTSKFTFTDKLDDYISSDGTIVLHLAVKNIQQGNMGRVPELKLNGEVAK